jgi:hypothetical protein
MLTAPAAASQLNFDRVGIEVRIQATTAAATMNTAVQVPCSDTALSPIDTLRIAEPATKIQSDVPASAQSDDSIRSCGWILTEEEYHAKHFFSDSTKHDPAGIVNSIHLRVA